MPFTTACIVNNYNYCRYLAEAVDSALAQTRPFDQIIVVDDCSTDGSRELLRKRYGDNDRVRLLFKNENGGQLSTFNEAVAVATADLLFFLDADDRYLPAYLAEAAGYYESNPTCDFLFCGITFFGNRAGEERRYRGTTDLGCSRLVTLYGKKGETYIGAATSTLSMKREVARRILPIPFTEDWRGRADDCLVWGASIVGARKHYLDSCLIEFRIHGSNIWAGRKYGPADRYRREIAIKRLHRYLLEREGLGPDIVELVHLEFRTIRRPTFGQFKSYCKITFAATMGPARKLKSLTSMVFHYAEARLGNGEQAKQ